MTVVGARPQFQNSWLKWVTCTTGMSERSCRKCRLSGTTSSGSPMSDGVRRGVSCST
ncbi:hypothetical protein [Actinomadura madurae]|uniref:hypothetical protein n=1 Tax=Actinomadura madurae TaxID=1993 RepID=UPI0020D23B08|nr:hypothetical protein [Actinomadura madurae]MCP9976709.1 hypothetical protein [Actinomadura madurae]